MSDDLIDFRGRSVIPGWPEMLASFQRMTHVMIGGKPFQRVRYGEEAHDYGVGEHPCRDCAAIAGEFHGFCVVERCPACGGQASSCECDYDEGDPEPEPTKPLKPKKKVATTAAKKSGAAIKPKAADDVMPDDGDETIYPDEGDGADWIKEVGKDATKRKTKPVAGKTTRTKKKPAAKAKAPPSKRKVVKPKVLV